MRRVSIPRFVVAQAIAVAAAGWAYTVMSLGDVDRDLRGVFLVAIVAVLLAPAALVVVRGAPAWVALPVAAIGYGAAAAWLPVASLPFGDQAHYLLLADSLAHGRLDFAIDERLFFDMIGAQPNSDDVATHVAQTPAGPRPIQGYALALAILPGWVLGERLGAGLVLALIGAWTSYQMLLILRDVGGALPPLRPPRHVVGWTWLIASACAPLALLATHVYPNVLGAALIATGYRLGFRSARPRPALAAGFLAATLFLTPRDAVPLAVLLPFLLRDRLTRTRSAAAAAGVALAVVAVNALLYGLPVPYAGYVFGTGQAQQVTQQGSITAQLWVTLPAILFDRTFGLLGVAPWLFVGLLGLAPALRADRARLLPAALAVGASVLALSFFRLWEGGYAPPARYFVDVLPLWAPFVAYGLLRARAWPERAVAAVLVAVSAVTSLILSAVPSLALNSAFDDKIRGAVARVGLDPLAWLPSFQPVSADWHAPAYGALVPALALAGWLIVRGARSGPDVYPCQIGTDPCQVGTETHTPPHEAQHTGRWSLATFLVLNALLIGATLVAAYQPWVAQGTGDRIPETLLRKWLPLALALAAAGTALVSRAVAPERRAAVLARHFWLYLAPLALMLMAAFGGPAVLNGQLGAVYLAVAVAFAGHALAALWPALGRLSDRGAALHLAAIGLVAMLVLLPYHRAVMPTASDEPHYLIVTQSLLYDRDLDVRNDYAGDRYLAFYPERLPDMHAVPVGESVFSIRDPALPILSVLPYAASGRLGVLALMCLVGAALVAQLYLLLRDLRFAPRVAFLTAATTALVHPLLTYTTQVYPELLAVLAFVTAVRLLRSGRATTLEQLALASALAGTLPWLSTRAWPTVVGLGVAIAWCAVAPYRERVAWDLRRIAAGAGPFLGLVLALALLNLVTFGLFMPSAGYFLIRENQPVLVYQPWIGAPGLLFDRAFGLIPRAPVYLLAFLGLVPLIRRARAGGVTQLGALALGSLFSFVYIADIHYWWADGSPPSRYALGSLPLLVAAVAAGWEIALARPWLRAVAAGAVVASALVTYVYAVLPNLRYDLAVVIRGNPSSGALFDFLAGVSGVDAGLLFPSLVRADPLSVALALAWTALAAALVVLGARAGTDREGGSAAAPSLAAQGRAT